MIEPDEIKKKAGVLFTDFLRAYISGENIFPLTLRANTQLTGSISDIQKSLTLLIDKSKEKTGWGYELTFISRHTRDHGLQTIPDKLFFRDEENYLRFIGKSKIFKQFTQDVHLIILHFPQLKKWAYDSVKTIVNYGGEWDKIIQVCLWFCSDYARDTFYIRQIPVNVHTKFIENYKGLIHTLLLELIPDKINPNALDFESRYYLKYSLPCFRMRSLDSDRSITGNIFDVTLDTQEWSKLDVCFDKIIITENLMTFLTLPSLPDCLGVFGKGFSVMTLRDISWLNGKEIRYWGDLDVQGFQILSGLRKYFPECKSVLMYQKVLDLFGEYAVEGKMVSDKYIPERLLPEEEALYLYLLNNNLRLEQERIPQDFIDKNLREMFL